MNEKAPEAGGEFWGLVAVVTGAAQGIGQAIAEHLHARGAEVILLDCNVEKMTAAAEALRKTGPAKVHSVVVDLADPAEVNAFGQRLAELTGSVDILINNAGIEFDLPFSEITA